jgi:L-ectoine synthase
MIVRTLEGISKTDRVVLCPDGGFVSNRLLLAKDGMGFSMHITTIPSGSKNFWHYKHHLEACYCTRGGGEIESIVTGEIFEVFPGTVYALDKNDAHIFRAVEETELVCVFNPPVIGKEVHMKNGAYPKGTEE